MEKKMLAACYTYINSRGKLETLDTFVSDYKHSARIIEKIKRQGGTNISLTID